MRPEGPRYHVRRRARISAEAEQIQERRISARQNLGRLLEIRLAHRHLEEEPGMEERLQDRPGHLRPSRVVFGLEHLAGSRLDDLDEPGIERPIRGEGARACSLWTIDCVLPCSPYTLKLW